MILGGFTAPPDLSLSVADAPCSRTADDQRTALVSIVL